MIASLITASIQKNDLRFLQKLDSELLTDQEKSARKWIVDYKHKYGHVPTEERFKETEHGIYWNLSLTTSPLEDVYSLVLANKRESYLNRHWSQIEESVKAGNIPASEIIKLGNRLSELNADTNAIFLSGSVDRDTIYSPTQKGIEFGWNNIDNDYGGLLPGDFCLIVARPKSFKTLATNHIAFNVASAYRKVFDDTTTPGKRVLYLSGEMTPNDIVIRMDAIAGGFNSKHLRSFDKPTKLADYRTRAERAWMVINQHGGDVIIPDLGVITIDKVLEQILIYKPDLVICDALYKFQGIGDGWKGDASIPIEISKLARITKTPIIGTTQLKRGSDYGEITLDDIAFSDSYGQDASLILAMYNLPGLPASSIIKILASRHSSSVFGQQINYNFGNSTYTCEDFNGE